MNHRATETLRKQNLLMDWFSVSQKDNLRASVVKFANIRMYLKPALKENL